MDYRVIAFKNHIEHAKGSLGLFDSDLSTDQKIAVKQAENTVKELESNAINLIKAFQE